MTVAELIVKLNADPSGLERGMSSAVRTANRFANSMESLGKTLSVAVTAPLVLAGASAVSAAADFDSLRRGMVAVTGSAAAAQTQLERMKDVARLPGLGFREAIQGSIRLQAIGISAQNSERYLRAFGNAVALTGGGKAELDRITVQLSQLSGKTKVLSQDIRPIIDAAPVFARAMREAFNTVDTEALQRAGISTAEFLSRMVAQLERLPPVTGGAKNSLENLTDSIYRARVAIGDALLPAITPLVTGLASMLEKVNTLNPETVRWGIAIAGVAVVIGPLILVLSSLTTAVTALAAAIGIGLLPVIAIGGPVLIALAALGAILAKDKLDALAAAAAVDQYKSSLIGMSQARLELERSQMQLDLAGIHANERALMASGQAFRQRPINPRSGSLGGPNIIETNDMRRLGEQANQTGARISAVTQALDSLKTTAATPIQPTLNLAGAGGADKLAGVLDRVGDEMRHLQNLMQFRGVIREDDLTEPFQAQLRLVDDLGNRVDTLSDQLARLGSRAPRAAFTWLEELRELLRGQTEELKRQADAWNALWASRFAPGGLGINMRANAPQTVNQRMESSVQDSLGMAGGTGRLLGDLGSGASLASAGVNALREVAFQTARTLAEAVGQVAGRAGEFAGNLSTTFQRMDKAGASFAGAASGALGLSVALEVAGAFFGALQPVLEAVTLPLRMLGEILSSLIIPVMRILFPVFKVVAIVASFLAETIAKGVALLLNAIGGFVRAVGKVINAITPFANPGNPLVKAGEAMQNTAKQFQNAASDMAKKRKELEGLSFDDALNKTSKAADRLTESLINTVQGFNIARIRALSLNATTSGPVTPLAPSAPNIDPTSTGGGATMTLQGGVHVTIIANEGEDTYAAWKRGLARDVLVNPGLRSLAAQFGV